MSNKPQSSEGLDDDNELEELDKLEADVNEMAQKILDYRTELPDQLKNTLASILATQRPLNFDAGVPLESGSVATLAEDDQATAEKTKLLRQKISSNATAMPIVLKRMKDCISRIDNLDSDNGIIHPAFKRKHIS